MLLAFANEKRIHNQHHPNQLKKEKVVKVGTDIKPLTVI